MKSDKLPRGISLSVEGDGHRFVIDIPEKRLLVAILWRAVQDIHQIRRSGRLETWKRTKPATCYRKTAQYKYKLLQWFASDNEEPWGLIWLLGNITNNPMGAASKIRNTVRHILDGKKILLNRSKL